MTSTTGVISAILSVAVFGGLTAFKTPGDKDVNVVNTPNVNVVNTPTVNVGNSVNVSVEDARTPVNFRIEGNGTSLAASIPEGSRYVVPEGKRLYLTHVSGTVVFPSTSDVVVAQITFNEGIVGSQSHDLVLGERRLTLLSEARLRAFSQPIDMALNAGDTIGGFWSKTDVGPSTLTLNISGYLVDQ